MAGSNEDLRGALHAAGILELYPGANPDRSWPAWHHECTRAAAAGSGPAKVDTLVEQVVDESLHIPTRPIEARVEIDERRRMKPSLEVVRVLEITASGRNQFDLRT